MSEKALEESYDKALTAAESPLALTKDMVDVAKDNKAIAIFKISARDFLRLTSAPQHPPSTFEKESKPLSYYNDLARQGKIIVMPFLKIESATAKVIGHEGRHRMGAVSREVGSDCKVPVAMIVAIDGYAKYYSQMTSPPYTKIYLGISDVPLTLHGQFMPSLVTISSRGAKELWK